MSIASDVTVISLVTNSPRDALCESVIPSIGRALTRQHVSYNRLPMTRDHIDWVVDHTDTLTVALDSVGDQTVMLLASRGADQALCAARLANIAADMCQDFAMHTVFWNGSKHATAAADFLSAGDSIAASVVPLRQIVPRKVRASAKLRGDGFKSSAQMDNWLISAMRTQMNGVTLEEVERLELEDRRAKSVPMRLSAWAISITTAIVAAPLAIPLIAHNLVRGEDVRAGALALGVAGLYAGLAQSGFMPELASIL